MSRVFDSLVGQREAVDVLRRAAAAAARVVAGEPGTGMTHAWIFTGPPGSGRSVAARAFAAALQCADQGCGECAACHTTLAGTHADVRFVVPEGLTVGVGEMRALVLRAAGAPTQGRWQVLLVEDADRLTEQAGNALLKAIEEPAPRTVWLLCAPSAEDLVPTIRSRCRVVTLVVPASAAVAKVLMTRDGIEPAAAWSPCASRPPMPWPRCWSTGTASTRRTPRGPRPPPRGTSGGPAGWPATRRHGRAGRRYSRCRAG